METPPQSPDINPIENSWDHLNKKVREHAISISPIKVVTQSVHAAGDRISTERVKTSEILLSETHLVGKTGREEKKKERTRKRRKKSSEKTRAGRFRKRRGESQSFLLGDADEESETRMSKNALRTGRRQAVE
ncbi:hypothetical protein TNCV_5089611 [Trichonephila clavipes]|nr:hypothetical protein TNCV_5089611 [Trichonephila clavipes]